MAETTASKYFADALHAYGVTAVFMVPTVGVAGLAELDRLGVTGIMTHGEKAAAYMADGYARVRRAPGICMAQNVGSLNLAAGLRDAFMARSPVIAITGGTSVATRYRNLYQEVEDLASYHPVTKFNAYVDDARRLPDLLRQAFRAATSESPGPVHLEVAGPTGQLFDGTFDDATLGPLAEERFASVPATRPLADDESIRRAVELCDAAERPVLLVGGGLRWSGAQAELLEVARALGTPVATSLHGKGTIDDTDPLTVGVVGNYSRASANRTVAEADLVFFIGSKTGSATTDQYRLPRPGARVVQLDISAEELGRNFPNDVSLHGDAKVTLQRLLAHLATLSGRKSDQHAAWRATAASYVQEWREGHEEVFTSPQIPMRPERILRGLTEGLPDDAVFLADTGHSAIWSVMVDLRPSQTFLRCAGSLGWAFPAALGAKVAAPERPVVCFTGDGGFYYHLAELETAARNAINAVIVVNDNRALSQDRAPFTRGWGGEVTPGRDRMWMFEDVNIADVARALGCESARVEKPDEFAGVLRDALRANRPFVIDAVTPLDAFPDPPYGGRDFYAPAPKA